MSQIYARWLKDEAERLGLPAVQARPWETVFDRICRAACLRLSRP